MLQKLKKWLYVSAVFDNHVASIPRIVIYNNDIERVTQAKVLGVTLSSDLTWNALVDTIVSKARKRVFTIYQLKRAGIRQCDLLKPSVHTNDFAPIHRLRALKLGHASLATVFRPGRLTLQPILRENLESPVLLYQPITTAVVTEACLNTRWHHGAYTSAVLRESLGLDRVVTVYVA